MADRRRFDAKKESAAPEVQPDSKRRRVAAAIRDTSPQIDTALFSKLRSAALNPDSSAGREAIRSCIEGGTRPEDLADIYIPAVARDLGAQWCEDQLSFAGVTIGVSRLQGMMRELGPNWASDNVADAGAPSIMLVVLQDVYHTLGAIVLGSQLRRKGLSVKMLLGGKAEDVVERLNRTKYHSVFISSSRGETLESIRRIVDAVKASIPNPPPVVVGGTILEVETVEDVTALTGADYATSIPDEALELCGLKVTHDKTIYTKDGT